MRTIFTLVGFIAVVAGGASTAFGHGAGFLAAGAPAAVHEELVAIFGPQSAFSATAKVTWTKADGVYRDEYPYHYRNGVLRLDRDHATNPFLSALTKQLHRLQGTDVHITLATKESISTVFPRLEAVLRMTGAPDRENAVAVEDLGPETVDGRPGRKRRIVVGSGSTSTTVMVWRSDDQQGLPLRLEGIHDGETTRIDFVDVRPDPAADLFEAPKDYETFERADLLLQSRKPAPGS